MANNSRYQSVPTQDTYRDDEPQYSQAPPSYSQADEQSPVLGEARTEDDNVPDDFKFGGSVAEGSYDGDELSQTHGND